MADNFDLRPNSDLVGDFDTGSGPPAPFVFQFPLPLVVEGADLTAIGPYILHTARAGERWDQLAWNYYGDATLYSGIVLANPDVPIEPQFEAGLLIKIPIIQQKQSTAILPPWRTL